MSPLRGDDGGLILFGDLRNLLDATLAGCRHGFALASYAGHCFAQDDVFTWLKPREARQGEAWCP